jgi:hypothetical protein
MSEEEADDAEGLRRMRDRRGAWEPGGLSGRAEWEEERRTVVGGERERRAEGGGC